MNVILRTSVQARMKLLCSISMAVFALSVSAASLSNEDVSFYDEIEVVANCAVAQDSVAQGEVLFVVEKMPEFPGGMGELMNFLKANVRYPNVAMENSVSGLVVVGFVVNADGSVSDHTITSTKITRPVDKKDPKEVRDSASNGKVPVTAEQMNESADENTISVAALKELVKNTPGMVVDMDGNVTIKGKKVNKVEMNGKKYKVDKRQVTYQNARIMLEKEAIRVLEIMPMWNPGIQKGKPVRVRYNIPVMFRLR